MSGYFGIGIAAGKSPENVGTLWRSAHAFGASFIFTVGHRYPSRRQATDTTNASRHVPLYEYEDEADFLRFLPTHAVVVAVEYGETEVDPRVRPVSRLIHPKNAVYLLGAEDRGVPAPLLARADHVVYVPSELCLNVAVAGSIVMYDRSVRKVGV